MKFKLVFGIFALVSFQVNSHASDELAGCRNLSGDSLTLCVGDALMNKIEGRSGGGGGHGGGGQSVIVYDENNCTGPIWAKFRGNTDSRTCSAFADELAALSSSNSTVESYSINGTCTQVSFSRTDKEAAKSFCLRF